MLPKRNMDIEVKKLRSPHELCHLRGGAGKVVVIFLSISPESILSVSTVKGWTVNKCLAQEPVCRYVDMFIVSTNINHIMRGWGV